MDWPLNFRVTIFSDKPNYKFHGNLIITWMSMPWILLVSYKPQARSLTGCQALFVGETVFIIPDSSFFHSVTYWHLAPVSRSHRFPSRVLSRFILSSLIRIHLCWWPKHLHQHGSTPGCWWTAHRCKCGCWNWPNHLEKFSPQGIALDGQARHGAWIFSEVTYWNHREMVKN